VLGGFARAPRLSSPEAEVAVSPGYRLRLLWSTASMQAAQPLETLVVDRNQMVSCSPPKKVSPQTVVDGLLQEMSASPRATEAVQRSV